MELGHTVYWILSYWFHPRYKERNIRNLLLMCGPECVQPTIQDLASGEDRNPQLNFESVADRNPLLSNYSIQ